MIPNIIRSLAVYTIAALGMYVVSCKTPKQNETIQTDTIQTDKLLTNTTQVSVSNIDTSLFNRIQYAYCDSLIQIDSLTHFSSTYYQIAMSLPEFFSINKKHSQNEVYFKDRSITLASETNRILRTDIGNVIVIFDSMINKILVFNRKTQCGYQINNLKISIYDILVQTYCIKDKVIVCIRESYEAGFMRDTYFLTDQQVSKVRVLGVFQKGNSRGVPVINLSIHSDSQVKQTQKGEVYVGADFTVIWDEEKKELYPFRIPINLKTGEFDKTAPTTIPNTFDWHVLDYKCEHLIIEKI